MMEQSVFDLIKAKLAEYDYLPQVCDLREAFPTAEERASELSKTTVSSGFSFDDGGIPAELGSDLCVYTHTVEFWVFGIEPGEAQGIASFIKEVLRSNMTIPLKDVGTEGQPVVGYLEIPEARSVSTRRQISAHQFPWDRFVWSTSAKFQDWYAPALI